MQEQVTQQVMVRDSEGFPHGHQIGNTEEFGEMEIVEKVDKIICTSWNEYENARAALKKAGVPCDSKEAEGCYRIIEVLGNISTQELMETMRKLA